MEEILRYVRSEIAQAGFQDESKADLLASRIVSEVSSEVSSEVAAEVAAEVAGPQRQ